MDCAYGGLMPAGSARSTRAAFSAPKVRWRQLESRAVVAAASESNSLISSGMSVFILETAVERLKIERFV